MPLREKFQRLKFITVLEHSVLLCNLCYLATWWLVLTDSVFEDTLHDWKAFVVFTVVTIVVRWLDGLAIKLIETMYMEVENG